MTEGDRSTLDAIYQCLANTRRRDVLRYLQEVDDGIASVGDLADYVVEQETNSPTPSRDSVLTNLYHTHLPMLAGRARRVRRADRDGPVQAPSSVGTDTGRGVISLCRSRGGLDPCASYCRLYVRKDSRHPGVPSIF
ncbi:DUF7344 domain-containing protein [Haloarcula ordinaria]|uniref:DUF7344 domain-containing protein n=1 Tax=Haloarcula ordinaria TaxID=3033390 RepID=UPI003AF32C60